jgi:prephenate dehydrogenase
MTGKTEASPDAADANLFRNHPLVLAPGEKTASRAIAAASQLIAVIGAEKVIMPSADHDRQVALISHLPFLLSASLLSALTRHDLWPEAGKLAAAGFHDVGRLASGDPEMYTDICITNRHNVLEALALFSATIAQVRESISREDADDLRSFFATAKNDRDEWLSNVWGRRESD